MKANGHYYDDIFSVCVLSSMVLLNTKSACLPVIESKSTIDHNWKLLQALDYGLKWVLSK